jgi:hypothetical protein
LDLPQVFDKARRRRSTGHDKIVVEEASMHGNKADGFAGEVEESGIPRSAKSLG